MGLIKKFTLSSSHTKIAIIVAPLLAIGGYILADHYASKKEAELSSQVKPLTLQSGCRLLGGVCELLHREIAINISAESGPTTTVYLRASTAIDGALLSSTGQQPMAMERRGDNERWKALLPYPLEEETAIQLAIVAGERRYYAEIPARK